MRLASLPPPHQTLSRRGGRRRVAAMKPTLIALLALGLCMLGCEKKPEDSCLLPGTKISMADGSSRNIEDIKAGDKVMAYNEAQGTIEEAEVAQTFVHPATRGYLTVNNKLRVTGNHPIYVMGRGWIRADELVVDDRLLHEDGADMLVEKIDVSGSKELLAEMQAAAAPKGNNFSQPVTSVPQVVIDGKYIGGYTEVERYLKRL